jgi:hypothetical protein
LCDGVLQEVFAIRARRLDAGVLPWERA